MVRDLAKLPWDVAAARSLSQLWRGSSGSLELSGHRSSCDLVKQIRLLAAAAVRDAPWGHSDGPALCVSAHQSFWRLLPGWFLPWWYLCGTFICTETHLHPPTPLFFFPLALFFEVSHYYSNQQENCFDFSNFPSYIDLYIYIYISLSI